jgi:hypothetical protein
MDEAMRINRNLVWDYPADVTQDEDFRRWYVARVLRRGGIDDVRDLGLQTIREYLPKIVLPKNVREFWEWYFGLNTDYGNSYRRAESSH